MPSINKTIADRQPLNAMAAAWYGAQLERGLPYFVSDDGNTPVQLDEPFAWGEGFETLEEAQAQLADANFFRQQFEPGEAGAYAGDGGSCAVFEIVKTDACYIVYQLEDLAETPAVGA